jgi:hypothetical protein
LLEYPDVFFCIVATTQATYNHRLRLWEMADNAPRVESVFVGHAPLPLAATSVKQDTAHESGCGIDIMEFTSNLFGDCV